jgi:flagellar motor switch protein FliN/FliY
MGTPPTTPLDPELHDYLQVWIEGMAQVLGQIAGSAFAMESKSAALAGSETVEEGDLQVMVTASGKLRGEMSLRLPRLVALAVSQLFLGETQDPTLEFKADNREAVEELLRQIAGHIATSLKGRWGEVQLRLETVGPPSWPAGGSGWIGTTPGTACQVWIEWQASAALIAALRQSAQETVSSAPAPDPEAEALPTPASHASHLDVFMEVGLGVTLRFGGRRMLLREVLELSAGAVVELDREVNQPVDLLLDGKLVARGDVVDVYINYGLRVTEVASSFTPAGS